MLPLPDAQRGLALLADAGMTALNFAGGEPFLEAGGTHVGELARFAKRTLRLPFVSVITNGSLVTREWLETYGDCLDVLVMQSSYLLLDEHMRFLNCAGGGKEPGPSLLDVGVAEAVRGAGFDGDAFLARGGDWALPQK